MKRGKVEATTGAAVKQARKRHKISALVDQNWKILKEKKSRPSKSSKGSFKAKNKGSNSKLSFLPRQKMHSSVKALINPSQTPQFQKTFIRKGKDMSKVLAMDCEMVGVGADNKSALARVCIVDYDGEVVLDWFSRPSERITDYRTAVSGIRASDLMNDDAKPIAEVSKAIRELLRDKILIGHSIYNDLNVLFLKHPKRLIRDTSTYRKFFRTYGRKLKLQDLAREELHWKIQDGEHDPYIDARSALEIYKKHEKSWERSLKSKQKLFNNSIAAAKARANSHIVDQNKDVFSKKK